MKIEVIFRILVLGASCLLVLSGATNQVRPGTSAFTPAYQSRLRSCEAFTDLLQLVENAQKDLKSLQTAIYYKTKNETTKRYLTQRAGLWLNKLHSRLPRVHKLCSLPRPLDNILEEQVNFSYKSSAHPEGDSYVQAAIARQRNHFTRNARHNCHSSKRDKKKCMTALVEELLKVASRYQEAASPGGEFQKMPEAEVLRLLLEILWLRKPRPQQRREKEFSRDLGKAVDVVVEESVAEVNTTSVVKEVPATFLSLALGPLLIKHGWMTFNTSSPQLLTLTRALAPAVLRMGGSSANLITYDPTLVDPSLPTTYTDDSPASWPEAGPLSGGPAGPSDYLGERSCESTYGYASKENFTITAGDWTRLMDFAEAVEMQLLFDLNQFYRHEDFVWDPSNARLLMQDAAAKGARLMWQLGNEPNSYYHNYNFTISGGQAAQDFGLLQQELANHFPPEHDRPIVGPDVTRPRKPPQEDAASHHDLGVSALPCLVSDSLDYLEEFLRDVKVNLTAVSWHQYYMDGHTADVEEFLSPDIMDQLVWQTAGVVAVRDRLAPGTPLWLTETSSAWGGGAPHLSNAYAGGFLWLDKLGVAAAGGVDLVARQTLYKGNYAMIDADLLPYPDYWLSVLYKRLVGGRVLNLSLHHAPPTTRLYAHCHNNFTLDYTPGSVVVYGMNLANETTQVSLRDDLALSTIFQYLLQAPDGDMHSRDVLLNGWRLAVTEEGGLPDLPPVVVPPGVLRLPPTSFGFWVLPHAHALACM